MNRRCYWIAMVVAAALTVAAAGGARAQPTAAEPADPQAEQRARVLYARGMKHYKLAEYPPAIAAFREAYQLFPSPAFLYNIAQAYRLQSDCARALWFYKSYLAEVPGSKRRDKVEQQIAEMEDCVRAGAVLRPERDRDAGEGETRTDASDRPAATDLLDPDEPQGSAPRVDAVAAAERNPGRGKRIAGIATVGVGTALLGAGVYFSARAASSADAIAQLYDSGGVWNEHYADIEAEGQRRRRNALLFCVAGGAAVAGGALLYYLGWRERRSRASVAVAGSSSGLYWTFTGVW